MPYSMTGFAFVKKAFDDYEINIKVKSLNNKSIDISIKGDKNVLMYLDLEIRKLVQQYFERGSFQLYININSLTPKFIVEPEKLTQYVNVVREITKQANINLSDDKLYEVTIGMIMNNNNVEEELDDTLKENILNAVKEALNTLKEERKREGKSLILDIECRLNKIEEMLKEIEEKKEKVLESVKEKVYQKVKQLLGENYSERAFIEATLLADKLDITEEVVRLKTHIQRFRELLNLNEPIGRKLDFMCQEMLREINTLGNKMPDFSKFTVEMKTELEKIRQQVQNIE
ncbi:YicC/YloC family endoribonuclease [Sulfurihydrogenibium sp.]|uniref:YicC/YloC family endoribonuclease n=1 Tax=Sulfurihydrogenibium sp. TaxID=2053621 RepID=UPI002627DCEC|nr:YicC/YloC family endoribonuclease [Sulfurihydrogenibium sp.]